MTIPTKIPRWLKGFIERYDGTIRFPKGISPLSSPPNNPNEGWVYLDDGSNTGTGNPAWRGYISSSWQDIGGSGGVSNPMTEDLDANGNSINNLLSLIGSPQSSEPTSPSSGEVYFDDGSNTVDGTEGWRIYIAGSWIDIIGTKSLYQTLVQAENNLVRDYSFLSVDGINLQPWTGSGTISASFDGLEISTGATDGSAVRGLKEAQRGDYDKDLVIKTYVYFSDISAGSLFIGRGFIGERDFTENHIGVRTDAGDIIGTIGNSTSETTTTLISSASAGWKTIRIEKEGSEVRFYIDGTLEGTISNGLPSGSQEHICCAYAQNESSGASDKTLVVENFKVVQDL